MKLQLKIEQLSKLDLSGAIRLLATNAKKIEGETVPIPVMIFAQHQYPDPKYKDKLLPLMLIGEYANEWKMEFNARKRKDASIGQCFVKNGVVLLELLEGRPVRNDSLKELTLILRQARLGIEIKESIVEDPADAAEAGDKNTGISSKEVTYDTPELQEKAAKAKDAVSKQAKKMTELLDSFKERFKSIQNKVVANIKAGNASRSDLVAVRQTAKTIDSFAAIYDKTHKDIKAAFAEAKAAMDKQKGMLAQLDKKVKAEKKSFTQKLADAFYMKSKSRTATEDEVTIMQESIKTALDHHEISDKDGEERKNRLKAIYATAQLRGAYFSMDDTDKVYEKMSE